MVQTAQTGGIILNVLGAVAFDPFNRAPNPGRASTGSAPRFWGRRLINAAAVSILVINIVVIIVLILAVGLDAPSSTKVTPSRTERVKPQERPAAKEQAPALPMPQGTME
jgi:hypothetical protein